MTTETTDTATAARMASVTPATIRTWARYGAITATKQHGRWVIDTASLHQRITLPALLRAEVVDLTAFRDAKSAKTNAIDLIETDGIIPGSRPGLWFATSSDGTNTYIIDTVEGSCTCSGHRYSGRCYHRVAAELLASATRYAA
jgi:hypothetical protein